MIDLQTINLALHDTLKKIAPDLRFIVVMWSDEKQGTVSSNEMDTETVSRMLATAARMVANTQSQDYLVDIHTEGSA